MPLRPWLLVLAVLLPAFALGGFLSAGREVGQLRASDPDALATMAAAQGWPSPALREAMVTTPEAWVVRGFLVLVAAIFLLLAVRWLWLRRHTVRLDYPGGRRVSVPYRWIYCLLIPFGATSRVDAVWAWGDLMNALQVFPNMVGLLALSGLVARQLAGRRGPADPPAPGA